MDLWLVLGMVELMVDQTDCSMVELLDSMMAVT